MTQNRTHAENIQKLADLIKNIKIAMLTTLSSSGELHSRPMQTQQFAFDGTLWFFTGRDSGKVIEMRNDRHVNVSYVGDNTYVSVSGRATLVDDRKKMENLWDPMFKAWFPDGIDDPNLTLMKVSVDSAEYWDSKAPNPVIKLVGFVEAVITGKSAGEVLGENERLDIR